MHFSAQNYRPYDHSTERQTPALSGGAALQARGLAPSERARPFRWALTGAAGADGSPLVSGAPAGLVHNNWPWRLMGHAARVAATRRTSGASACQHPPSRFKDGWPPRGGGVVLPSGSANATSPDTRTWRSDRIRHATDTSQACACACCDSLPSLMCARRRGAQRQKDSQPSNRLARSRLVLPTRSLSLDRAARDDRRRAND